MAAHVKPNLIYSESSLEFLAQQEFKARVKELQKSNSNNKDQGLLKIEEVNI